MRILPAALVVGAAGAGYLYDNVELAKFASPASWVTSAATPAASENVEVERLASAPREELVAIAGPDDLRLEDIFRFDVTPKSITDRWSRVSTGLGDVRYQGYRVPLVTGTTPSDLAGSLTYYFDAQPRLRRIQFLGTTGDPARVVDFLSAQFGFRRNNTGNPRVMSYRGGFRYTGSLEITPSELLDRHQAETNYQIDLSLER